MTKFTIDDQQEVPYVLTIGARINHLEGHYALRFKTHASFGAHHENLNEDVDPYYRRQGCSAMTVVSGSIRFMRIFAEIHLRRGVKRQWGNRKHRFLGLSDAMSSAF